MFEIEIYFNVQSFIDICDLYTKLTLRFTDDKKRSEIRHFKFTYNYHFNIPS